MRVPPRLAEDILALHGLVARQHILDDTRQHMADMRLAICCRRAVVESEGVCPPALGDRLMRNVFVLPKLQDLLLAIDEVQVCIYLGIQKDSS